MKRWFVMSALVGACSRYEPPLEDPVLEVGPPVVGMVCEAIEVRATPVGDEEVTWTVEAAPPVETLATGSVISAELVWSATTGDVVTVSGTVAGQYFVRASSASGSDLVKVTITDEVTTLDDVVDPDDGLYSLRELADQAQLCPGDHAVVLPTATEVRLDEPLRVTSDLPGDNLLVIHVPSLEGALPTTIVGTDTRLFEVEGTLALLNVGLSGGYTADGGGAVWVGDGGFVQLQAIHESMRVEGARADDGGGAVHLAEGALGLVAVGYDFVGNSSGSDGGAIHVEGGAEALLDLRNLVLEGNDAAGRGGGIFQRGGALSLTSVSLVDNEAEGGGGAICLVDGAMLDGSPTYDGNVPDDLCARSGTK